MLLPAFAGPASSLRLPALYSAVPKCVVRSSTKVRFTKSNVPVFSMINSYWTSKFPLGNSDEIPTTDLTTDTSAISTGVGSFAWIPSLVSDTPFSSLGLLPLSLTSDATIWLPESSKMAFPFSSSASPNAVAWLLSAWLVPSNPSGSIVTVNTTSNESPTFAVPPEIMLRAVFPFQLVFATGAVPVPLKF